MSRPTVTPPAVIARADVTGLVLAGGQGTRMEGRDKGLQPFHGVPLASHALDRLRPQVAEGQLMVSANRHLDRYAAFGAPVIEDAMPGHPGPLAGMLAGLDRCATPWLLTVPCDVPRFPADLARRLAEAAAGARAPGAIAAAPETPAGGALATAPLRRHPVACLLHASLRDDLRAYLAGGGRKVMDWMDRHGMAVAVFGQPGDDPHAFRNANTLAELHRLETDTP
ncbi:molybdenum cofactor guanylyltransferase [Acidovorax sp. NCPPB 2350]|nr:molybdenum cofactor guanylyltransferase [Acidovorax sp. NCPPB 2350]